MIIFENFFSQIQSVFINGVFGLSLGELGFILVAFIFALLVRGLIAKFIVNKVKLIVLKTTNSIGFASISWAKKNGLRKLRPFLKLNNS